MIQLTMTAAAAMICLASTPSATLSQSMGTETVIVSRNVSPPKLPSVPKITWDAPHATDAVYYTPMGVDPGAFTTTDFSVQSTEIPQPAANGGAIRQDSRTSAPKSAAPAVQFIEVEPVQVQADGSSKDSHNERVDRVIQFASEKEEAASSKGEASALKPGPIVLKLAIVLILAYFSMLALKLLSVKREAAPRVGRELMVEDTVKLSQTNSLHVISFNGKKMLVGCSTGQVNLLREFDEVEAEVPQPETARESGFAEYLAKYSAASFQKTPAGRVAGLLRDCASHLKNRQRSVANMNVKTMRKSNEA